MTKSFRVNNLTSFRNTQKPAQHLLFTHRKHQHQHHPNIYIISDFSSSEMTSKLCRHICLGFKIIIISFYLFFYNCRKLANGYDIVKRAIGKRSEKMIPTQLLRSCVNLGKVHLLSGPHFPHV